MLLPNTPQPGQTVEWNLMRKTLKIIKLQLFVSLERCMSETEVKDIVNRCSAFFSVSFCGYGCLVEMLMTPSDYQILFGGEKEETVLGRIKRASTLQMKVPLFNWKFCHSCLYKTFYNLNSKWKSLLPFSSDRLSFARPMTSQVCQPRVLCCCSVDYSFPLFFLS